MDVIPFDAPNALPQSAEQFIASTIVVDRLPAGADRTVEIHALLTDLQRVISLYKFDVSDVDPIQHGYFRIDSGDVGPY